MTDPSTVAGAATAGKRAGRPLTLVLVSRQGGGALSVVARLADAWARRGRDVRIMTNLAGRREWDTLPPNVQMVPLPALPDTLSGSRVLHGLRYCRYVLAAGLASRREARARPSEPFIAFLPGTALLILTATLWLGNPVLVCERNDLTRQPVPLIVRLGRRLLYPRSSTVAVNHTGSHVAARRIAGRSPTAFVPNPPPQPAAPADVRRSRTALNVGRLVAQKNQHSLLQAFGAVRALAPTEWRLRIVGDGPLRTHLEQSVAELGLKDGVLLTGHAEDVSGHYRDAAFLVLTSAWEGTPNVVLEAQAHGLPVIVPRTITDGSELVTDGEDGLVYDAAVQGDLERCMALLMDDRDLRVRLGVAAWHRAVQRHQRDAAGDWLRLIDSLPVERR